MSSREVVVLGTGSQVPTARRNHNGYVLRWDGLTILFDPGEGTQRQLLRAGVSAPSLDRICLTHLHGDHCLGLPGVLMRRAVDEARTTLTLHHPAASSPEVAVLLRAGLPADAPPWESGTVLVRPVDVGDTPTQIAADPDGRWRLLAATLDHRIDAVGYRLEEPDGVRLLPDRLAAAGVSGPDVGVLRRTGALDTPSGRVRLEDVSTPRRGQSFAFVMDTRPCPAALRLADGVDLLVVESTYLHRDAALADSYGHLTARQAGELALAARARSLVLTHFSRRYGDDGEVFAEEARTALDDDGRPPIPVTAAEDLDVFPLPARRTT